MQKKIKLIKQKILIIEDEPKVSSFIKKGLEANLYEAEIATDGLVGREMAMKKSFDIILLDINLPIINGFDVCRQIKAVKPSIPVLIVSAYSTNNDIEKAISCGADSFIVKPFEFAELIKQIKSLLQASINSIDEKYFIKIHDLEINLNTKIVKRSGKNISLSTKEFDILRFLVKNKNQKVNITEIEKFLSINNSSSKMHVFLYIGILQKKIDLNHSVKLIHKISNFEYILEDHEN